MKDETELKAKMLAFTSDAIHYLKNAEMNDRYKNDAIIFDGPGERMNSRYVLSFLRPILHLDEKIKKVFRFPVYWVMKFEEVQATTDRTKLAVDANASFRVSKIGKTWKVVETEYDVLNIITSHYFSDKEDILGEDMPNDFTGYVYDSYFKHEYIGGGKSAAYVMWDRIFNDSISIQEVVIDMFQCLKQIWEGTIAHVNIEEI